MGIALISPATGARLTLLTDAQWAFIDRAGRMKSVQADAIDFLHLNRSRETDDSLGAGIQLAWQGTAGRCRVTLRCRAVERVIETTGSTLTVYNLRIGERYNWSVSWEGDRAEGWFETADMPPRFMHLDGTTNVRDLGGWPTETGRRIRQGLIYRGSELDSHLQLTSRGANALLHQLRVKTDLDLRAEAQSPALDEKKLRWVHLPVSAYGDLSAPDQLQAYGDVFRVLLNEEMAPVYVHCWGGADRTGCLCYLLGALLGMREEHLLLDYELTSLSIWGDRSRDSAQFQRFMAALDCFAPRECPPRIRAERYWLAAGITIGEMDAFRRRLLENN